MNITLFQFDTSITIRTVTNDGDVLFVARDVAVALGYTNSRKAVQDHCKRAKSLKTLGVTCSSLYTNQTLTLDPQTKLIDESDVYRLVMRSRLPSAERFQDWVVEEVLPTLRKTGKYSAEPEYKIPQTYLEALEAHLESLKRVEVLEQQTIEMLPKAEFHDNVADAKGLYTFFLGEINKVDAPVDADADAPLDAIEDGPMPEADQRSCVAGRLEAGRLEAGRSCVAGRPEAGPSASEAAREEGRMLLRRWTTAAAAASTLPS